MRKALLKLKPDYKLTDQIDGKPALLTSSLYFCSVISVSWNNSF